VDRALARLPRAMKRALGAMRRSRAALRVEIATCYAAAQYLAADDGARAAFAKQKFWQEYRGRPTETKKNEILRHAVLWARQNVDDMSIDFASLVYRALGPSFRDVTLNEPVKPHRNIGAALRRLRDTMGRARRRPPQVHSNLEDLALWVFELLDGGLQVPAGPIGLVEKRAMAGTFVTGHVSS
jgi:hypothetical protein